MRALLTFAALGLTACASDPDTGAAATDGTDGSDGATEPLALSPALSTSGDGMLTDLATEAVSIVPAWLRDDLALSLADLDEDDQNLYAALLLDLDEPWLLDEVAFPIAHMPATHLGSHRFYPELLVENARLIYARDEALNYVEIVEHGEAGVDDDWHTTTRYVVETEDGERVNREIDRDIYYWYLVHPRIEDELPYYIDGWAACGSSECPSNPEEGTFWRSFLWDEAAETCPSDRECPVVSEYLTPDVEVLWKSKAYNRDDNGAIGRIIQWQKSAMRFGAGEERPIQPNRIYAVGCGNCGEWADMATAAARSGLIPGQNVGARSNDHTWNEFWDDGWQQWEPVNTYVLHWTYYADAEGNYRRTLDRIDNDCDGIADEGADVEDHDEDGVTIAAGDCDDTNPDIAPGKPEVAGNGIDDDCDGVADDGTDTTDADADGVSIADGDCDDTRASVVPGAQDPRRSNNICFGITASRPDSLITTDRTPDYAKSATLEVTVTDDNGLPVDGAVVTVVGNWSVYGEPDAGAWASEGHTDTDGIARITIGEGNPYGFLVESPVGDDPGGGRYYGGVVEDAVWGEVYGIQSQVSGAIARPEVTVEAPTADAHATLTLDLDLRGGRIEVDGAYRGVGHVPTDTALLDVFVLEPSQYDAFVAGAPFTAAAAASDLSAGGLTTGLPMDRDWVVVVANTRFASTAVLGAATLQLEATEAATFEPVEAQAELMLRPEAHVAFHIQN